MTKAKQSAPERPTILIAGASGLFGPYLVAAANRHDQAIGLSRRGPDIRCDLLDADQVTATLARLQPDVVIHAAALTNVDECEAQPSRADALHRQSVATIAAALSPSATLVYISTDQVYPDTPGPHREPDTNPVNIYGSSKLAGEAAALTHPGALIVRTNLFGPSLTAGRHSLSDFMVERLRSGQSLTLFRDAWFSPLHMGTLADTLIKMIERGLRGVYNVGCRDGATKMAFGLAIARHLGIAADNIDIVDAASLAGRVRRAKDLRMDVSKLEQALGAPLPTLLEEVAKL